MLSTRRCRPTPAGARRFHEARARYPQQVNNAQRTLLRERDVRIRYEETGSGFPLLLIAGGGLNGSTIAGIHRGNPFNTVEAFKEEFRCIYADLRNSAGQSTGPLEIDRPWDSYTDDHIGYCQVEADGRF